MKFVEEIKCGSNSLELSCENSLTVKYDNSIDLIVFLHQKY